MIENTSGPDIAAPTIDSQEQPMPFYPRALTLIINSLTAMSRDEEAAEPGVTSEACAQFAYSNFEVASREAHVQM